MKRGPVASCRPSQPGAGAAPLMLAALLAGCSGHGRYHVIWHPMLLSPALDSILSRVRDDPPDIPNPAQPGTLISGIDPNDPAQAVRSSPEPTGEVWIFPARMGCSELRIHIVRHPQNYDDSTDFDVRVEVIQPYAVIIDGQPFLVSQDSATARIEGAFASMVRQLNNETPVQLHMNAGAENQPVVNALRELAPWVLRHRPKGPWAPEGGKD